VGVEPGPSTRRHNENPAAFDARRIRGCHSPLGPSRDAVSNGKVVHKEAQKRLKMATYQLNVNGQRREVTVDPSTPLLWVLREDLKMTGTKFGCGISACGACTVHVGGIATRSCIVPISHVGDRPIVTIEGIGQDAVGRAVQDAWVDQDVVQCGYCQSGQIMAAVALLKHTPKPTDKNIEESMGGNICRCGTYPRIREAIKSAAAQIK
jgi:isoquinoline 1-oxidoreductase subunit alpha